MGTSYSDPPVAEKLLIIFIALALLPSVFSLNITCVRKGLEKGAVQRMTIETGRDSLSEVCFPPLWSLLGGHSSGVSPVSACLERKASLSFPRTFFSRMLA